MAIPADPPIGELADAAPRQQALGAGRLRRACPIRQDAYNWTYPAPRRQEAIQLNKFEPRLLQGSKAVVVSAIALTSFCAIAVLGWQLQNFLSGEGSSPITVSEVLQLANRYTTASFNGEPSRSFADAIYEWFLALPAISLLLLALGLLAIFYQYLKSADRWADPRSPTSDQG